MTIKRGDVYVVAVAVSLRKQKLHGEPVILFHRRTIDSK